MVRRICLKRRLAWRARPLAVRVAGALGSVLCFAVMLLKLALGSARSTQTRGFCSPSCGYNSLRRAWHCGTGSDTQVYATVRDKTDAMNRLPLRSAKILLIERCHRSCDHPQTLQKTIPEAVGSTRPVRAIWQLRMRHFCCSCVAFCGRAWAQVARRARNPQDRG